MCVGFNQDGTVCTYNVDSYYGSGWDTVGATAFTNYDAGGLGITDVDILRRDIAVVFDGVYGDPITTATGASYHPIVEGGSEAWIFNATGDVDHPENPSPGAEAPFLVRVPFKVYDLEADEGTPQQIGMIMRDRIQDWTVATDPPDTDMYAFNPDDRMYCYFVHRPYEETLTDFASNEAYLTWNTVWWNQQWTFGDSLTFEYSNPIIHGDDEWTFSTVAPSTRTLTDEDVDMINIFPNPYYGFQELEIARAVKFATINHLPQRATVRIFNLGGNLVRTIEKDDETQYAEWDLENQYGFPVASGVYVIHIDLPDLGKETVLKFAMVQEEQILLSY
jgi:hypothetical protein